MDLFEVLKSHVDNIRMFGIQNLTHLHFFKNNFKSVVSF